MPNIPPVELIDKVGLIGYIALTLLAVVVGGLLWVAKRLFGSIDKRDAAFDKLASAHEKVAQELPHVCRFECANYKPKHGQA